MFMDDTALVSTSKEGIIEKFKKCQEFCDEYGMTINQIKTKFMAINKLKGDDISIKSNNITVEYCSSYLYLGAQITDDGRYHTAINLHVKDKMKHIIKYYSFLNRNPDLPFKIKKRVAEACLMSSLLYGTETLLCETYGNLERAYMRIVKSLLFVRESTCNDVCLVESGMMSLKSQIKLRRDKFIKKQFQSLHENDPLKLVWNVTEIIKPTSFKIIDNILNSHTCMDDTEERKSRLKANTSSKRATYCTLNPTLQYHIMYSTVGIIEHKRVAVTRFRVSAHNLKIETGRWNRTPRNERKCSCPLNEVQDEYHVVFKCKLSDHLRRKYDIKCLTLEKLFEMEPKKLCNYIFDILKLYEGVNTKTCPLSPYPHILQN